MPRPAKSKPAPNESITRHRSCDSDTALRGSAFFQSEASPQVVSEAKDNMASFVLTNCIMSSNQFGDCNARSARRNWAINSQVLVSQSEIRKAPIEAAAGNSTRLLSTIRSNEGTS